MSNGRSGPRAVRPRFFTSSCTVTGRVRIFAPPSRSRVAHAPGRSAFRGFHSRRPTARPPHSQRRWLE